MKEAIINFSFDHPLYFMNLILECMGVGWRIDAEEKILFMAPDDNESEEKWEEVKLSKYNKALDRIKKNSEDMRNVGIRLTWEDTMFGGLLVYRSETSPITVSLIIDTNNPKLINNDYDIIDFSWYVEKIDLGFDKMGIGFWNIDGKCTIE